MHVRSVHMKFLLALQTVVRALGLDGQPGGQKLPAKQVYVRKLPTDRQAAGIALPAVIVSLVPAPEGFLTVVNNADDYGYPCLVTVINANNQDLTVNDFELYWRQQIRNAFHNRKPAALITAVGLLFKLATVKPGPVLDLNLFLNQNLFVSALQVDCWTREAR